MNTALLGTVPCDQCQEPHDYAFKYVTRAGTTHWFCCRSHAVQWIEAYELQPPKKEEVS